MKPVFFSAPERCVSRDDALVGRLVELWEASVRATHDFLSEEDIRGIRTYVPDALRSIADLRIVRDAEGVPVAFMGCDGRRLEMLFVDPACRGAGVGTALVREAFAAGVTEVVVNEQNPSARGFYEHVGFAVCGRSERDEQGGPFPILYMKLNDNNKPNMEKAIAKDLLSIGAVFLRPEQPFTWASGIKSPIYCDNRLTLTAPEVRKHVEAGLAEIVRTKFPEAEVLMGTSTAGIAHAAITATILDLPMGYVRSGAKDHGRGNRIEGRLEKGQKVVVIEDLISTAGSCIEVVEALREAGAEVESLYRPTGNGDDNTMFLMDRLEEENKDHEELLNRMVLKELMEDLSDEQREIIVRRYFYNQTQTQIAGELGISQVQVSRLEKRILKEMRMRYEK